MFGTDGGGAEEEGGKKGEGRWTRGTKVRKPARISEKRLSRIPLASTAAPFDTLGGYRLTAIRLNLFHHKRLNKEVHSSGAATPSDRTAVRSQTLADLLTTLIGLCPPLTTIHLDRFLSPS